MSDESFEGEQTGHEVIELRQRLESLRRAGLDRVPWVVPASRAERARKDAGRLESTMEVKPPAPARPAKPSAEPGVVRTASLFDPPRSQGASIPTDQRAEALMQVALEVRACQRCAALADSRTQTVFGEGSPSARLMFIGEAPGADEDRTGRPFVGRAGQLLTDMITKGMGLRREDVYIANILKCRPPENRQPLADEVAHCRGYLERQCEIIHPEFLCLLGKTAAAALLDSALSNLPLGKLRGRWFHVLGIRTLVTYHPAYLLRNPASKREAWEDLKRLMAEMGIGKAAE